MTTRSMLRALAALAVLMTVLMIPAAVTAQDDDAFETPPVLRVADVVDRAELLSGPRHRLDDEVAADGFFYHYVIHSDFGDFEVVGEALLETRVQEVYAIEKLREMSRNEAFAGTMKDAAMRPVDAAGKLVTKPVETVKGLPGGVTRKVRGFYYQSQKTTRQAGKEIKKATSGGEETADAEAGGEKKSTTAKVTEETTDVAKSVVGYNSARRDLARRLEIDPYSSNPVLQQELERLSQAAFAAGFSFKMVAPTSSVVDAVEDVSEMVWNLSPSELERLNNQALKKLGIEKSLRLELFDHPSFTSTHETLLVRALEGLEGVERPDAVLEVALGAQTDLEAFSIGRAVRILALYHQNEQPLAEFVVGEHPELGRLLAARTAENTVIVPGAVDHLTWQADLAVESSLAAYAKRELWLAGGASPRARREFEARGWRVVERAFDRLEPADVPDEGP